jgi:hypothetical protein
MKRAASARTAVARASLHFVIACAVAFSTTSCAGFIRWPWGSTQRWPEAMENTADPLPPGQSEWLEEGPEEVLVVRHADPVKVRPAGLTGSYPLKFYDKSLRVHAGSAINSAPGGRIEVVWPNGNSLVMFDRGAGAIGSPSRGQPSFIFLNLTGALVRFKVADQVQLPTGVLLSAADGPFTIELVEADVLRISNRSKGPGEVQFRDEVITLDIGQIVDVPMLSAGGKPQPLDPNLKVAEGPGYRVSWSGSADVERGTSSVRLRALEANEVRANGVRVKVDRDESVVFEGLGANHDAPAAGGP